MASHNFALYGWGSASAFLKDEDDGGAQEEEEEEEEEGASWDKISLAVRKLSPIGGWAWLIRTDKLDRHPKNERQGEIWDRNEWLPPLMHAPSSPALLTPYLARPSRLVINLGKYLGTALSPYYTYTLFLST